MQKTSATFPPTKKTKTKRIHNYSPATLSLSFFVPHPPVLWEAEKNEANQPIYSQTLSQTLLFSHSSLRILFKSLQKTSLVVVTCVSWCGFLVLSRGEENERVEKKPAKHISRIKFAIKIDLCDIEIVWCVCIFGNMLLGKGLHCRWETYLN